MIVITSDKSFMKSFPHMAAIALGRTTVLFFSKNNWRSNIRGEAFLIARSRIFHALKKQPSNFIACVGMGGSFNIIEDKPKPTRKYCDPLDWESYERVCQSEGIVAEAPKNEQEANGDEIDV
jgi:hypothetical protein